MSLCCNRCTNYTQKFGLIFSLPAHLLPKVTFPLAPATLQHLFPRNLQTDPNSGTSALIEVARGLGVLLKGGWEPLRTIILCSWSGEELGMIGSTAWGEENAQVKRVT